MKIASLFIIGIVFLQSCDSKKESIDLVKYNFKYSLESKQDRNVIIVNECSDNDFSKYWIFSYLVMNDFNEPKKSVFYFETRNGVKDSIIYNEKDVLGIQQNFKKNSCLLKSCDHIMMLTNEKILFYDKILYDIMKYDSQLNGIDTAYYAYNDVSIAAILFNKCLYDENNLPPKYLNQSNYLKVIPIWCENRKTFPLFDQKDLEIKAY